MSSGRDFVRAQEVVQDLEVEVEWEGEEGLVGVAGCYWSKVGRARNRAALADWVAC
jgi:energy-converting hydrogenase Eha subunit G